jgi:hypothetical protein
MVCVCGVYLWCVCGVCVCGWVGGRRKTILGVTSFGLYMYVYTRITRCTVQCKLQ